MKTLCRGWWWNWVSDTVAACWVLRILLICISPIIYYGMATGFLPTGFCRGRTFCGHQAGASCHRNLYCGCGQNCGWVRGCKVTRGSRGAAVCNLRRTWHRGWRGSTLPSISSVSLQRCTYGMARLCVPTLFAAPVVWPLVRACKWFPLLSWV